ncbi:PREDICTED: otopetrin-1 [Calidris pugnax]|uniref:otopetrin-1 n=1 Tax=Calidris pugnax TaxID=198806 RepID=UPI00071D5A5A|nr:PREDICTED: otopetrin-1 [Calidris pugnax]
MAVCPLPGPSLPPLPLGIPPAAGDHLEVPAGRAAVAPGRHDTVRHGTAGRGPAAPLRPRPAMGGRASRRPRGSPGRSGPACSQRPGRRRWEMEKSAGSPSALGSYPQKNAEILSSQYGINLFLAGLLLTFAWAVHAVGISKSHLLSYLITLMLIQLLWMLWYLGRSCTQRRLIRDKDTHAGARWLKCAQSSNHQQPLNDPPPPSPRTLPPSPPFGHPTGSRGPPGGPRRAGGGGSGEARHGTARHGTAGRGPAAPLRPRPAMGGRASRRPRGSPGRSGPACSQRPGRRRWEMEKSAGSPSALGSYPQKNAEILSSQYGINLFLAGLLLTFAWAVHAVGISKSHLLSYLITLMLIQLLWMLWYLGRSCTQRRLIRDKDTHAGARWLKCGITLFAVITLILDSFKIGYYVDFSNCLSPTEGIFPVTHAVHTILQVYFLWCHAKDIIQSFKTLERFGVIHSVFTNLLLWTNGVLTESKHQLNEHKERLITLGFGNITIDDHAPQCNCTTTTLCSIFSQGIYYLYPFNIEYHILASTMLYVLWKNIGRKVEHHQQHKTPFKFHGITVGTVFGLAVLTSTIAIVVVYLIQIGRSKIKSELALTMFYLHAIFVLALMCTAGIVALLIYRLEDRSLDNSKNPARKLDAELLVGTAAGSWLLSWGSILAIICAQAHPKYTWYNLPYSVLVIIEKYIQNLFIIESIHREQEKGNDDIKTLRIVTVSRGSTLSLTPSYKEIYNGRAAPGSGEVPCLLKGSGRESNGGATEERSQEKSSVVHSASDISFYSRNSVTNNKRRILKNIAAFLFLCNLSLWIPPAFGCRPEYDNGLEEIVFGFEPWIIVVNLAMPFSIFYRMHSAASLFEVNCKT